MNEMEYLKVQMTKENIDFIKQHGSFAKVLNLLVQEMREDERLTAIIQQKINNLKVEK